MSLYSLFVSPVLNSNVGLIMVSSIVVHACIEFAANKAGKRYLKKWKTLTHQQQAQFGNTVAATCHAIAAWGLIGGFVSPPPALQADRIYGYSPTAQFFLAWSSGYFLYDIFAVITEDYGIAYIIHGIAAFASIFFALFPFLHYYASFYVGFFELSTPFLHLRSLLGTYMGMENSIPHLLVSVVFLLFFFGVRIFMNSYVSFFFWQDMLSLLFSDGEGNNPKAHSNGVVVFYLISNLIFYTLHLYWCKDILKGILEVLGVGAEKTEGEKKKVEGGGVVKKRSSSKKD